MKLIYLSIHLRTEVFDFAGKGSVSLVNNGCRIVNQMIRSILKCSEVYVNILCILNVKYSLWTKALSKMDLFPLSQNGALGQFRDQKHCTLQKNTVMCSVMLFLKYIVHATRRESFLFTHLDEYSQF